MIHCKKVSIPQAEVELTAMRSQGAGGQNVNKVSSAIHLRFDILHSSLPQLYKDRLRSLRDSRVTDDGIIIIKAQRFRTQEQNRKDAIKRLVHMIDGVSYVERKRRPTKPSTSAVRKRLDAKSRRSRIKELRKNVLE